MVGAPTLTARAALRTGAGLATIASSDEVTTLINRDIEEIMTFSLPSWNDSNALVNAVKQYIKDRHVSVLVIGPGLPSDADEAIRALITSIDLPVVLDAEAFTALSTHLPTLKSAASTSTVLTPHPGEFARLTKNESQYSAENEDGIQNFARDYNLTLVLKEHHTLVVDNEGNVYKNATGNPGLATAGAGDVLAGIIGGMLAQKNKPYEAAKMSVYLHGKAGDIAASLKTQPGMIASDIIEAIPEALAKIDDHF